MDHNEDLKPWPCIPEEELAGWLAPTVELIRACAKSRTQRSDEDLRQFGYIWAEIRNDHQFSMLFRMHLMEDPTVNEHINWHSVVLAKGVGRFVQLVLLGQARSSLERYLRRYLQPEPKSLLEKVLTRTVQFCRYLIDQPQILVLIPQYAAGDVHHFGWTDLVIDHEPRDRTYTSWPSYVALRDAAVAVLAKHETVRHIKALPVSEGVETIRPVDHDNEDEFKTPATITCPQNGSEFLIKKYPVSLAKYFPTPPSKPYDWRKDLQKPLPGLYSWKEQVGQDGNFKTVDIREKITAVSIKNLAEPSEFLGNVESLEQREERERRKELGNNCLALIDEPERPEPYSCPNGFPVPPSYKPYDWIARYAPNDAAVSRAFHMAALYPLEARFEQIAGLLFKAPDHMLYDQSDKKQWTLRSFASDKSIAGPNRYKLEFGLYGFPPCRVPSELTGQDCGDCGVIATLEYRDGQLWYRWRCTDGACSARGEEESFGDKIPKPCYTDDLVDFFATTLTKKINKARDRTYLKSYMVKRERSLHQHRHRNRRPNSRYKLHAVVGGGGISSRRHSGRHLQRQPIALEGCGTRPQDYGMVEVQTGSLGRLSARSGWACRGYAAVLCLGKDAVGSPRIRSLPRRVRFHVRVLVPHAVHREQPL